MSMRTRTRILPAIFLLGVGWLFGQTVSGDPRVDIRGLRDLSDADYIRTATDFSVEYSGRGNWANAAELLDAAATKGRRTGGKSAAASVHLAYVEALLACWLASGEGSAAAQRAAANSLVEAHDLDNQAWLTDQIKALVRQLNARTSDPAALTTLFQLADRIDPSGRLSTELRGSTLGEVEKQNLANQSSLLRSAVRAQEQEIQNLSLTAARERAMAEYHKKVADSLHFVGLIDSLQAVQREQALAEQAVTIKLQ